MVVFDREASFGRQPVAIAPDELPGGPIKIGAVSIGNQNSSRNGNVKRKDRFHPIYCGLTRRRDDAVSHCQHQRPGFRIVQIEKSDVFQFEQGLQIKFDAGPNFGLGRIATFSSILRLKNKTHIGIQFEISINLRQEFRR